MGNLFRDFKYALRILRRQPALPAVALLTLVLGIGATVAIFTVVKGVLLDPLPFLEPERLVVVWERAPAGQNELVSGPAYRDWRAQAAEFDALAAYRHVRYTFTAADGPINVAAVRATPSLFAVLRRDALRGRTPAEDEGEYGRDRVAVLGHGFWQRHFGGDERIIGQPIALDSQPFVVIGVMPPDFAFPPGGNAEIWTPLSFDPNDRHGQSRRARALNVIGRLAPGATLESAQQQLSLIAAQLAAAYPESNDGWDARVVPAHEQLVRGVRPALLVVFAAVGALLLIVCANVANLMLARLASRRRELAVRAALGARRLDLVRQVLTESVALSLAGGALGLLAALAAVQLAQSLPADSVPRVAHVRVDAGVLLFTIGLSLGVAAAFGLLPALQATRANLRDTINEGSGGGLGSPASFRLLNALVVLEVAVALVLLIGAGLLTRSFAELLRVDPGFASDRVVAAQIFLPDTRYPTPADRLRFFDELVRRVRVLPGVAAAAAVTSLPLHPVGIDFALTFSIDGVPFPPGEEPQADIRAATPGYFETMRTPLLRGRLFDDRDRRESTPVMVVNETLARRYFGGQDPVGRTIKTPHGAAEVIGVVGDTRHYGLDSEPRPAIFLPFLQNPFAGMALVVRTGPDPAGYASLIRREVLALDAAQPIFDLRTMEAVVAGSVFVPRVSMLLLAAFAGSALLMAVVGVYGVVSYSVGQRTRELGLRVALGARPADTVRMVATESLRLAAGGVLLGLAGALAVTRWLASLLYGVGPLDPFVFGVVPLTLLATAVIACLPPALRATRVDPIEALRTE